MRTCRAIAVFVVFGTPLPVLEAKLSSCDQVGYERSLPEDQNPGIQGRQRATARLAGNGNGQAPLVSWILVFGEAGLAADLITARKFNFSN